MKPRDRDKDAKQADYEFRKAKHDEVSAEQIMSEDHVATKLGLPTTLENADGSVSIPGPGSTVIRQPTDQEVASFAVTPRRTVCGSCRFFDLEEGQKKIIEEDFGRKLAKELEWNPEHLSAPLDTYGLCGMSNGEMACSVMTLACDQFRGKGRERRLINPQRKAKRQAQRKARRKGRN
jgi:hypothetical protein